VTESARGRRRERGLFVVVAGPDGTGKTTVVAQLLGDAGERRVLHLHHRPMVLGGRARADGPVTEPHREPPYPRWLSFAKLSFVYLDHLVGWFARLRPHLRAGGDVVLERGWWDLGVDPRRYRLHPHPRALAVFGRLLPGPDVTLLLEGDPAVIAARKGELSVVETARQLDAWRAVVPRRHRVCAVDVTSPPLETARQVATAVTLARRGQRWLALPLRGRPRWFLPVSSGRALAGALRVHQPVTLRGRWLWRIARSLARTGGGRLLARRGQTPPPEVLAAVEPHVPTRHQLAVAQGRHAGRWTVLSVDERDGAPGVFAKVALDPEGPDALAHEAAAARSAARLLPSDVTVPEVLACDAGVLVSEARVGHPRPRPWRLPDEVAAALGTLFGSGDRADGTGPCHGDCAPWNVLDTADGWCLVDWADARRAAPPYEDVLHHLVQSHALLGRPDRHEVLDALAGRGPYASAFVAYAEAAGCDLGDLPVRAIDYLHRSVAWLDLAAEDGRRGHQARARLLQELT
jgi:hypothetical protein